MCSPKWTKENSLNSYCAGVLCFWLPSIILFLSNVFVIHTVRRLRFASQTENPGKENEAVSKINIENHTETLRCLYVLHIVYFGFGAPYFLGKFSNVSIEGGYFKGSMMMLFMLLMFITSAINPFIYTMLRKEHRKAMTKTIKRISAKKNKILSLVCMKLKNITSFCKMSDSNGA